MSSFARQPVPEPPRFFVSKASRFASTVTDHRPFFHSEFACHRFKKLRARMPALQKSLTLKIRFTFFKEGLHAFIFVFAGEAERKEIDFPAQTLVQI